VTVQLRAALPVAILAASLTLIVGCTPAQTDSGVRGTVRIGPISPVQQQGQPSDAPYAADLVVTDSAGAVVARVRSGADGSFGVDLAPGSYTITGATGTTPPTPPGPQAFTVRAHEFSVVTLAYDSGIR
jgi:hypothetical protein